MTFNLLKTRSEKLSELLNWDNSDPQTNGEYFILKHIGYTWNLCFDIGANQGEYTKVLLQEAPKAKIISFEPNPSPAKKIKRSGRVKVETLAIGDRESELTIYFNKSDDTQSSSYRRNEDTEATKVSQVSLDTYIKQNGLQHIDFIKIDTEGHELAVLKGAKETLKNQVVDFIQPS